jgi:hypothetical protein
MLPHVPQKVALYKNLHYLICWLHRERKNFLGTQFTWTPHTYLVTLPLGEREADYGISKHIGWWGDLFHEQTFGAVYG